MPQTQNRSGMGHHARGLVSAALNGAARRIGGPSGNQTSTGNPAASGTQRHRQSGASGASGPARPQSRRRSSRQSQRGTTGSQTSTLQPSGQRSGSQRAWAISERQRPPLIVGEGDLAQVFSCLTQLWHDCPGAAVATCRFIAMHQRPSDPRAEYAVDRARNSLTRLLRKITPNAASLASAKAGVKEARSCSDPKGRLTADTTYLEEQYLRFVYGLPTEVGLRQLVGLLITNAEELRIARSEGRQAYPRLMAADIFLQLGDIISANGQIAQAFYLIGKAYPNPEMVKLGESMGPDAIHSHDGSGSTSSPSRQPAGSGTSQS